MDVTMQRDTMANSFGSSFSLILVAGCLLPEHGMYYRTVVDRGGTSPCADPLPRAVGLLLFCSWLDIDSAQI